MAQEGHDDRLETRMCGCTEETGRCSERDVARETAWGCNGWWEWERSMELGRDVWN